MPFGADQEEIETIRVKCPHCEEDHDVSIKVSITMNDVDVVIEEN